MLDFLTRPMEAVATPRFRVLSTFSGAGGSSLGYRWAGGTVLAAVEWNAHAAATYRLNFPETPLIQQDIATVTAQHLLDRTGILPGELDILDGSPPCQGFSTAMIVARGERRTSDPRNGLFREYVRLLRELRPKVLVMENVSGMIKGPMKHLFALILRELKASGYRVSCRLMNVMYFGVPQARERVIFIGVREDLGVLPSHPGAQTHPIPLAAVIPGVRASRSMKINSWTPASRPCVTVMTTPVQLQMQSGALRMMTLPEAMRVSSFPDAWRWPDANSAHGIERLGNSVPPEFMRHIATHLSTRILPALAGTHQTAPVVEPREEEALL